MKYIFLLAVLISIAVLGVSQSIPLGIRVPAGTSLPALCPTASDSLAVFYVTTGTPGLYTCTSTNTWTPAGGAGVTITHGFYCNGSCDISSSVNQVNVGANGVNCQQLVLTAGYIFNNVSFYTTAATGTYSAGIYNSSGNLVAGGQSSNHVSGSSSEGVNLTWSALTLPAGTYGGCWSSTGATDAVFVLFGSTTGYNGGLMNQNESSGTYKNYTRANAVSGGVWPSTCGTQTPVSGGGTSSLAGLLLH